MQKERRSFFERLTGASDDDYRVPEETKRKVAVRGEESAPAEEDEGEGQLGVDVYQTPDDIIIKTMVAGVRPEDLDISISRDTVSIKGSREESREVTHDNYFHRELYWGTFSRTIVLSEEIDVENAEASEKHGLLIIRLPKLDKHRETKLKVRSN